MTKGDKRVVQFRRQGKLITRPLTKCGTRFKDESKNWYVQYRDADGQKKRTPGYSDKEATRQLAAEIERRVERKLAGLSDPFEQYLAQSLKTHLAAFKEYLANKGDSEKHVNQTCNRIKRCFDGCRFKLWTDISASKLVSWLASERKSERMGIKTSNYYQSAAKEFCNWMVKDQRVASSPLNHLAALNSDGDVRRKRRAVSETEFDWLIKAASIGPEIQCVTGPDRAMLYVLATWTGYRRKELASLTLASLDLDSPTPSIQVAAAYSKRKRNDSIPLHAIVIERLKAWLAEKSFESRKTPLFNLRSRGGSLRRTAKMMKCDLKRARGMWIDDADTPDEKEKRRKTDFLNYCNEDGLFADFHSNRHTFITNLGKAGLSPKMAQTLARHSDPKLTMNIYSHVETTDQAKAIERLAPPPNVLHPNPDCEPVETSVPPTED